MILAERRDLSGRGVGDGLGRPPKAAIEVSPPQAGNFGNLGAQNPSAYVRIRYFQC